MTDNIRIRFLVLFSVEPDKMNAAGEYISSLLSKRFGGATLLSSTDENTLTGFWAEDGSQFKKLYEGRVHREPIMGLMLSVLPEDEDEAYDLIQKSLSTAAEKLNLNTRHVHVETMKARAHHFDIEAIRKTGKGLL
ncbi:hypothetical protein [Marinobacter sp.]|uniref:hypothetical protein n=1 Tax=Marinobacter sp. TaxID=50741 RepID=UPI003A8F0A0E